MEDFLPQSHYGQTCLNGMVENLIQVLDSEQLKNGNGILITSTKESKIESPSSQALSPALVQDPKNENKSSISPLIEEKENIMNVEVIENVQPTEKCSNADISLKEALAPKGNSNEEITQGSPNDRINREQIQKIVDEILEDSQKTPEIKEPSCKKIPRYMKRQRTKTPHFNGTLEEDQKSQEEENLETNSNKTTQKKNYSKKHQLKSYSELINLMQCLVKFEWFEGNAFNQKLFSQKYLTPNVAWFLFCANYFPKNAVAHKNPKEFVNQRIEKLKSFIPEIPERITKADVKNEFIQKNSLTETESMFIDSLRKGIKAYSDTYVTADYHKKTMSSRIISSNVKTAYTAEDDEWIMQTRRFLYDNYMKLKDKGFLMNEAENQLFQDFGLLSKIDLQDLITLYEKDLYDSIQDNEKLLENLGGRIIQALAEEETVNRLKFDPASSISDLKFNFPEDEQFISLLERKQLEGGGIIKNNLNGGASGGKSACNKPGHKSKRPLLIEDMVCHVCNDGDYTDDDLIVFCARCNISVHQMCYGISVIPKGDWICDVCLNFGENGKYLRCPLCDKRGGAMKHTNLRADTEIFENLNPGFHTFLKSYASEEFLKSAPEPIYFPQENQDDPNETQKDDDTKASNYESDTDFSGNLYYDIQFLNDNFTDEELVNEPKPAYVWVHMTCAIFISELYFEDQVNMTNILGLENVTKDRFKYECEVCGKKRNGSIINCGKGSCKRAFHPECARRAKYFLDIKETESYQLVYHIFCEKHTPLKLKRTLESREKHMKDEINKYFKMVEKCCNAAMTGLQSSGTLSTSNILQDLETKHRKQQKKEDGQYFMSLIEKYKEITAQRRLAMANGGNTSSENSVGLDNPDLAKLNLIKERKLTADDEIWGIMPYKNLTPEQKYKKYRKILAKLKKKKKARELRMEMYRKNMEKAREAKNKLAQQKSESAPKKTSFLRKDKKNKEEEVEEEEDPDKLYCLCQKKYKGELMTACNGCGEWFHPKCLGIAKHFVLNRIKWWCKNCSKAKGYKDIDLVLEDKLGKEVVVYKKRAGSNEFEKEEPSVIKKVKLDDPDKEKIKKKV